MRIQTYHLRALTEYTQKKQRDILLQVDNAKFQEKQELRDSYKGYLISLKLFNFYLNKNTTIKKRELYELLKGHLLSNNSFTKESLYQLMRKVNDL